jgi:hypothetical protein
MGMRAPSRSIFRTMFMSAAVVVCCGRAHAASITYDTAFAQWPGPVEAGASPVSALWPQFNPALGTLNSVVYAVTGTLTFTLTNPGSAPSSTIDYQFSVGLTGNGTGLTYKTPFQTANMDANINWGVQDGPVIVDPGATTRSFAVDFQRTPDLGLAGFIGTGSVNFDVALSDATSCYDFDGITAVGCLYGGNGTLGMTYTYTPPGTPTGTPTGPSDPPPDSSVPAPSGAGLMLLGLLGVARTLGTRLRS